MIQDAPILDAITARTILDTLAELDCGLSQRQIDMKRTAKEAVAYWATQQTLTLTNPITGPAVIRFSTGGGAA